MNYGPKQLQIKFTGVCEASHTQSHTQSQTGAHMSHTGEKMYKRIDQKELDDQLDQYEIETDRLRGLKKCDQCYKRFSISDLNGGRCVECCKRPHSSNLQQALQSMCEEIEDGD
jgi:hypothetical protein